jgi:hypothetical protein
MGEKINICQVLVGKPKGKKSRVIPKYKWMCNIKLALKEIIWDGWNGLFWLWTGKGGHLW